MSGNYDGDRTSVLLVEDDDETREALARALHFELEVIVARNGHEALVACSGRRIDLVVTDLNMPVMDGATLIRQLRLRGVEAPVILISGDERAREVARTIRALAFLAKPFELGELLVLIRAAEARDRSIGRPKRLLCE